jgi:hypothetical protein
LRLGPQEEAVVLVEEGLVVLLDFRVLVVVVEPMFNVYF